MLGASGEPFPADLLFRAVGVEGIHGVRAIRFDGITAPVRAWFNPGIPYPLRLEVLDAGQRTTLDLTGYEPGNDPLDLHGSAPASGALPLPHAPREPWGPVDAGVGHPFPLSTAFRLARSDPSWDALALFLAEHPDAFVYHADYAESGSFGSRTRTWTVALAGQEERFAFEAEQEATDAVPPAGLLPPERTTLFDEVDVPTGMQPPAPARAPRDLPTVAGLAQLWRQVQPSADPFTTYGFSIACADDACARAVTTFTVGHQRDTSGPNYYAPVPGDPFGAESRALVERTIDVRDGRLAGGRVYDDRSGGSSTTPLPPAAPVGTLAQAHALPRGEWPTASEAATASAFGALLALLYYAWPRVDLGVLAPLFSRVRRDAALEHPRRQRICDAVQGNPGLHLRELQVLTQLDAGSVAHHVRKLEQCGLVTTRRIGRFTCVFPGSSVQKAVLQDALGLRSPGGHAVLSLLEGAPGLSNKELAARTGMSPSSIDFHLKRLRANGVVRSRRDGRFVRYVLTQPHVLASAPVGATAPAMDSGGR
jgi:DNA-binding transcriptional ArsR family regulator